MTKEELILHYPTLFHMAEDGSWESIERFGLLSTTALLDLFQINRTLRAAIESQRRPDSVPIRHSTHGIAIIRDQKPMSNTALIGCLEGMTPSAWYQLLNGKVFFWLRRERLSRLLQARAYRDSTHCVLTIDTAALLNRHLDKITLSPINSGSTIFKPQPRGPNTFLRIDDYPFDRWSQKRGVNQAIVELAVEYSVPDITELVVKVEEVHGNTVTAILLER
jgi:Family of unknown function (DUF7002)